VVSDKGTEVAETITDGQIVGTNSEKLKVGDLEREVFRFLVSSQFRR